MFDYLKKHKYYNMLIIRIFKYAVNIIFTLVIMPSLVFGAGDKNEETLTLSKKQLTTLRNYFHSMNKAMFKGDTDAAINAHLKIGNICKDNKLYDSKSGAFKTRSGSSVGEGIWIFDDFNQCVSNIFSNEAIDAYEYWASQLRSGASSYQDFLENSSFYGYMADFFFRDEIGSLKSYTTNQLNAAMNYGEFYWKVAYDWALSLEWNKQAYPELKKLQEKNQNDMVKLQSMLKDPRLKDQHLRINNMIAILDKNQRIMGALPQSKFGLRAYINSEKTRAFSLAVEEHSILCGDLGEISEKSPSFLISFLNLAKDVMYDPVSVSRLSKDVSRKFISLVELLHTPKFKLINNEYYFIWLSALYHKLGNLKAIQDLLDGKVGQSLLAQQNYKYFLIQAFAEIERNPEESKKLLLYSRDSRLQKESAEQLDESTEFFYSNFIKTAWLLGDHSSVITSIVALEMRGKVKEINDIYLNSIFLSTFSQGREADFKIIERILKQKYCTMCGDTRSPDNMGIDLTCWFLFGISQKELGNEVIDKIAEIIGCKGSESSDEDFNNLLSKLYENRGDYENALIYLNKYKKLNPEDLNTKGRVSKINRILKNKAGLFTTGQQKISHKQTQQEESKYEEQLTFTKIENISQQFNQDQQLVQEQKPANQELDETLSAIKSLVDQSQNKDTILPKVLRTLHKLEKRIKLLINKLTQDEKKSFNNEWKIISDSLDSYLKLPTLEIFSDHSSLDSSSSENSRYEVKPDGLPEGLIDLLSHWSNRKYQFTNTSLEKAFKDIATNFSKNSPVWLEFVLQKQKDQTYKILNKQDYDQVGKKKLANLVELSWSYHPYHGSEGNGPADEGKIKSFRDFIFRYLDIKFD